MKWRNVLPMAVNGIGGSFKNSTGEAGVMLVINIIQENPIISTYNETDLRNSQFSPCVLPGVELLLYDVPQRSVTQYLIH